MKVQHAIEDLISDLQPELDRIEAKLAEPSAAMADAAAELEAARAAVAAAEIDNPKLSAAEIIKARRAAAERFEIATLEHGRAVKADEDVKASLAAKVSGIVASLDSIVSAEASRRREKVRLALRDVLGAGTAALPGLIENRAEWVTSLSSLAISLRGGGAGSASNGIALARKALKALGDPAPAVVAGLE